MEEVEVISCVECGKELDPEEKLLSIVFLESPHCLGCLAKRSKLSSTNCNFTVSEEEEE